MRWVKRGLVYAPAGDKSWARTHAMIPTPLRTDRNTIRVYVTCRDDDGIGRPGFVEVDASQPTRVLRVGAAPCIDIGPPGSFDENGVLACSLLKDSSGRLRMYYVGFELGTRIRYRLLAGLAFSDDGGMSFQRVQATPVLERSPEELLFRGGPCVLEENGRFRMWYVAGSTWTLVDGKPMPEYTIRYLESADGIRWRGRGRPCLDVSDPDEYGFGRPWVVRRDDGRHEMFYSIRRRSLGGYRLGYATSPDGVQWTREDARLGLDVSPGSFDGHAIMYSAVIDVDGRTYCFYNGDDFGRDGFAVAELVSRE